MRIVQTMAVAWRSQAPPWPLKDNRRPVTASPCRSATGVENRHPQSAPDSGTGARQSRHGPRRHRRRVGQHDAGFGARSRRPPARADGLRRLSSADRAERRRGSERHFDHRAAQATTASSRSRCRRAPTCSSVSSTAATSRSTASRATSKSTTSTATSGSPTSGRWSRTASTVQVVATVRQVTAQKPMAFTSLNGEVDVTLPASLKASLKLRSDQGDVYTDFDVQTRNPPPASATPDAPDASGTVTAAARAVPASCRSVHLWHGQRRRAGNRTADVQRRRLPQKGN